MIKFFPSYISYVIQILDRYVRFISSQNCNEIVVAPLILEKINRLSDRFLSLHSREGLTESDQLHRNLRSFQTLLMELEELECFALPIITHYRKEFDGHLTSILQHICDEIGCPVDPPHVCTLSTGVAYQGRDYYWYHSGYETVFVPAAERFSLLNLPDLLHELGHHILLTYQDHFIKPFSKLFSECHSNLEKEMLTQGISDTDRINASRKIFLEKWPNIWGNEIVCDLIAVYCVGQSYAWTNLKLCQTYPLNISDGLYNYSNTHPPDACRMDAILRMLKYIDVQVGEIEKVWLDYERVVCHTKPPLYDLYFPTDLVDQMVHHVFNVCDDIGLVDCKKNLDKNDTFVSKLEKAWLFFRKDPAVLLEIEKEILSVNEGLGVRL